MRLNGQSQFIDDATYPITTDEFIAAYGEQVIECQTGDETVAEVLSRLGTETYDVPADVYDALYTAVGHEAIGRRFYSDREPPSPGADGPDQVSF